MNQRPPIAASSGFTLVELVITLVLLGILSAGTFEYVTNAMKAYRHASRQEQLTAMARIAVEKIGRELRNAHPASVRISPANNRCIEFFPITGSGTYQDDDSEIYGGGSSAKALPTGSTANQFDVFGLTVTPVTGNHIVVGPRDFYAVAPAVAARAPFASISTVEGIIQRVTLGGSYRFQHSPARRVYVVEGPAAFCLEGSDLLRRTGYAEGSDPATGSGVLTGEHLDAGSSINYSGQALTRNGVVQMVLAVTVDGDSTDITHEVQIRNVP